MLRIAALAALVVAAAAAASAADVPFTSCASSGAIGSVKSITASPYPLVVGQKSSMSFLGAVTEEVTSGTFEIDVSVFGVSVGKKSGSICELSKCPIAAGDLKMDLSSFSVPSNAPADTYDVKLTAANGDSKQVLCVDVQVKIVAASEEEAGSGEQAAHFPAPADDEDVNNAAFIDFLNKQQTTWQAGHNARWEGLGFGHVRQLCGALEEPAGLRPPVRVHNVRNGSLPTDFDSRKQWGSMCPSLTEIRDQASCGSCWAVSAAETMSDRTCIASNGTLTPYLSGEDILSCCGFFCGSGCDGGFPSAAQSYWVSTGVVTGGPYNSKQGCLDYSIAPCEHHVSGPRPPCQEGGSTPQCTKTCQDGSNWAQAKHFGSTSYSISSDVEQIMTEIYTHGPVQGTFSVYSDFPTYKSGVYQHTSGSELGGHAIEIIGWGEAADGTPYWTVRNSWNTDWGNNGYFNILRGQDECGIESGIVAGLPKLH